MKKGMIKNVLPDYKFGKLDEINENFFSGCQLIIFDVDNTLVFSETTETKKEIIGWFLKIKRKYRCVCLSNSPTILKREQKISELLGCKIFLSMQKKPSMKLFKDIKEKYNINNNSGEIFVVGDRIFTDILFGNRNGAKTVLVNPLGRENNIFLRLERKIEDAILFLARFLRYN